MRAYSMDLRERVLLDSDAGMKAADVAAKYRVSETTAGGRQRPPAYPYLRVCAFREVLPVTTQPQAEPNSSNPDLLDILDGHLVGRSVVELGRALAFMRGDRLRAPFSSAMPVASR